MGSITQTIVPTPPHPRVLGWVGTTALAMGGSNQMIFIITALFIGQGDILGQGSAAVPLLIVGVLLGLGRGAGLDRAGADVAQSRRRHLGRLRGSLPALQPGPRRADRHLLLVGLGADLRADCAPFRGAPSSNGTCRALPVEAVAIAHRAVLHRRESLRGEMDRASRDPHCRRLGHARFPFRLRSDLDRRGRLAAGVRPST